MNLFFSQIFIYKRLFHILFSKNKRWSWQQDLNPRPTDYKSVALPTELCQHYSLYLERETGLEPATYSLEGCRSSQLSYSRALFFTIRHHQNGGENRIRTCEGVANGFTVRPLWPLGNLPAQRAIADKSKIQRSKRGDILPFLPRNATTFFINHQILHLGAY